MAIRNVTIVGVGALGSHLTLFLRGENINIKIIDFDRVENKNTLSQFHAKNTVGKNKALALQQSINFLFGKKVDALPRKLENDNMDQLLGGSDIIIDCLDNGAARKIIQFYVRKHGIECLHGALSADGMLGRIIWDEDFRIDSEDVSGQATCEAGEHLPFICMVSAYMARVVQEYLKSGKKLAFQVYPISGSSKI